MHSSLAFHHCSTAFDPKMAKQQNFRNHQGLRSPPENDAQDELQPPSRSSRSDPRVLLARLSSLFPRSQLNTDDEAELHPTTPLSSRPDALISRLSSLFRSQPHANEEIKLTQRPSRPGVVGVAAVRDRQALVVARGPQFEKAKRAYEQAQLHAQAQALSSHTQPADASTSATPAPGTAAAQPPPIQWWAQIVLFLCCASPSHANGHEYSFRTTTSPAVLVIMHLYLFRYVHHRFYLLAVRLVQ
ncbi:hypothetical protein CY34DRAFT_710664 [Suillus luteus UH-Slu-Lm8-n1]|uniref:Unplaced genomic scaffold CY34scaffold_81, whole genome shotgun sequence n=1 Tax=Suillus luteus UH-Slu-Lm8-n1 TaxID=930992 RepID=A0A0D0BJS3_9AGAM|nr:hypothetical protein CY34DRAFT_710664 [Suillus luteus UH-Slu-Lm8-n1]